MKVEEGSDETRSKFLCSCHKPQNVWSTNSRQIYTLVVKNMEWRPCTVAQPFHLPIRSIFPRISSHDLPHRKTKRSFSREIFPNQLTSQLLRRRFVIRTSCLLQYYVRSIYIHVECIPSFHDQQKEVGSSRSTFFINFFHMGPIFCFFPAIFLSSTYNDKNNPCVR